MRDILNRIAKAQVAVLSEGEVIDIDLRLWRDLVEAAFASGSTHLVITPAFKDWFKNSKVVDEQGNPLVAYHGTTKDIGTFDLSKSRGGFYFTADPDRASRYGGGEDGGRLVPVYLCIQKPAGSQEYEAVRSAYRTPLIEMQRRGYDGVIYDEGQTFLVFNPNQIKSATGNKGSFDPSKAAIHD